MENIKMLYKWLLFYAVFFSLVEEAAIKPGSKFKSSSLYTSNLSNEQFAAFTTEKCPNTHRQTFTQTTTFVVHCYKGV